MGPGGGVGEPLCCELAGALGVACWALTTETSNRTIRATAKLIRDIESPLVAELGSKLVWANGLELWPQDKPMSMRMAAVSRRGYAPFAHVRSEHLAAQ